MDEAPVVDVLAVRKALAGVRVRLYPAEQHWAIHEGIRCGLTHNMIARRLRMSFRRVRAIAAQPAPNGYDVSDPDDFAPAKDWEMAA